MALANSPLVLLKPTTNRHSKPNDPTQFTYTFSDGWDNVHGSWLTATLNDTMKNQSFTVSFWGTHIVVYGYGDASFDWSIDAGPSNHHDPPDEKRRLAFNSTLLDDKNHTLAMGNFSGSSISVGPSQVVPGVAAPLSSITLEADNSNPSIMYDGQWISSEDTGGLSSLRSSATKGDSVAFGFCGTRIAVQGSFDDSTAGTLTLSFTVDMHLPQIRTYDTQTAANASKDFSHSFFSTDVVDSEATGCQHTINVTILDIDTQLFSFGSFNYVPSFTSLLAAPSITVPPFSSAVTTGPSPGASTSAGAFGPDGHPITNEEGSRKSSIVGPVVGGVVGGIVFIACILMIVIFLLRRRREAMNQISPSQMQQDPPRNPFIATPFILPDHQQAADYFSHGKHNSPNGMLSPAQRKNLAESRANDATTAPPASEAHQANAHLSDAGGHPFLPSNDSSSIVPPSSPDRSRNQDGNGSISRQVLDLVRVLESRVDALHNPPAYEEPD